MKSIISIVVLICAITIFASCKTATGPGGGNNGGTTPASLGDSVLAINTHYTFDFDLLDTFDAIIPGYPTPNHETYIDSTGLSILGKTNVYRVIDDAGDTTCLTYEYNGDVSVYLVNPGYYQIYYNPYAPTNEPLQQIDSKVFAQWITLPIASKVTNQIIYNKLDVPIVIGAGTRAADIYATVDYISDTNISVSGKIFTAKKCRITITSAKIKTQVQGSKISSLTHVRTFWFVPKLGYFAKLETRTDMQPYGVDSIPFDTTGVLKVLTKVQ